MLTAEPVEASGRAQRGTGLVFLLNLMKHHDERGEEVYPELVEGSAARRVYPDVSFEVLT